MAIYAGLPFSSDPDTIFPVVAIEVNFFDTSAFEREMRERDKIPIDTHMHGTCTFKYEDILQDFICLDVFHFNLVLRTPSSSSSRHDCDA